jgi:uncharacterized protein (TIGR02246 family)
MKRIILLFAFGFMALASVFSQDTADNLQEREIHELIANYSLARDTRDTVLLLRIVTPDIDQLVSSGTWRRGRGEALKGMMQSSENNPGSRVITIDKIRFLNKGCAIADARYEIQNEDGSARKMWSTFVVVKSGKDWKISAIRNMLPRGYNN